MDSFKIIALGIIGLMLLVGAVLWYLSYLRVKAYNEASTLSAVRRIVRELTNGRKTVVYIRKCNAEMFISYFKQQQLGAIIDRHEDHIRVVLGGTEGVVGLTGKI